eukprot:jgi/Galph1/4510/GphlegSOOS_G3170.1
MVEAQLKRVIITCCLLFYAVSELALLGHSVTETNSDKEGISITTQNILDEKEKIVLYNGQDTSYGFARANYTERLQVNLQEGFLNDFLRSSTPQHGELGATCTGNSGCVYGLVCLNSTCSYCTSSSQCESIQLICGISTSQCTHKPLTDFTWRDGLTFVLVFIIAGLSNAGGVGGGFLFVPVLVLATGYRASTAAAISQALVTGASGANTFYGLIRRHPKRERPRIDYGVVIHFIPSVLCGTSIGVLLNELFPNFFTLFCLAALVLYVFYVSLKKGISLWKQERKEAKEEEKERLERGANNQTCATTLSNDCSLDKKNNSVNRNETTAGIQEGQSAEELSPQPNGNNVFDGIPNDNNNQSGQDTLNIPNEVGSCESEKKVEAKYETDDVCSETILAPQPNGQEETCENETKEPKETTNDITLMMGAEETVSDQPSFRARIEAFWNKLEKDSLRILDQIPALGRFIDPGRYLKTSEDIIEYEKRQYPWECIIFVIIIFVFLVVFSLLRGGHAKRSLAGVPLCGAGYTVLYVVQEIGLLFLTLLAGIRNVRIQTLKEKVGYPFYAKDFLWTKLRVVYFSPLMIVLGAIGAWVGAGGSFMSTPILVAGIGMDPVVVQSTAGLMNFISGFSSALQYLFDHQMKIDYGVSLGATTLVGSFTGLYILNGLVNRYNLQAILVIVMSLVMFGAFAVDLYAAVKELISVLDLNEHFPITSICAVS